jgi:hypothetical protein
MGGLHIERTVDVAVDIRGYGHRDRRDRIQFDLSATYGLSGPREGLGALVQFRWFFGHLFGLAGYMGGDVGSVLFNPNPGLDLGPSKSDIFVGTVRFALTVGLAWEPRGVSRLPSMDAECVRNRRTVDGCTEAAPPPTPAPPPTAAPPPPAPAPSPPAAPPPAPAAPAPTPAAPSAPPADAPPAAPTPPAETPPPASAAPPAAPKT